ncbi:MAG: thiol-disulfide oxidoreductase DCC family protein [Bradymonadaceae bacterium]
MTIMPHDNALPTDSSRTVVLFDGVCNFCNGAVQFIINRDPGDRFRFASLQSDIGQRLLRAHGFDTEDFDTMVAIAGDKVMTKSDAALYIARKLGKPWPVLSFLKIIPRFIRNFAYDWIAHNRYRFFGKKDQCMTPSPENRRRFLEVG